MNIQKIFTNKLSVGILAVITCLLWGSAFPSIKTGFRLLEIGSADTWYKLLFASYRFLLAGFLILLFALVTKQDMRIKKSQIKSLIIMALFSSTLQYVFFYIGLSHTSGINASIANATFSFFSILLAHFFLQNDGLSMRKNLGLLLGFSGVIAINFSPELLSLKFSFLGDGLVILSQLMGAIAGVYLKTISQHVAIIPFTGYQMVLGASLIFLPSAAKVGIAPFHFDLTSGLLLLYLGALSAISFSLWNTLIKYNPVGKISFYLFLIPIFGVILSAIILAGEKINFHTVIALILVSGGLLIVNTGEKQKQILKK